MSLKQSTHFNTLQYNVLSVVYSHYVNYSKTTKTRWLSTIKRRYAVHEKKKNRYFSRVLEKASKILTRTRSSFVCARFDLLRCFGDSSKMIAIFRRWFTTGTGDLRARVA